MNATRHTFNVPNGATRNSVNGPARPNLDLNADNQDNNGKPWRAGV